MTTGMKDSDDEPFTPGNKANGSTAPFCSLNTPKHGVNWHPSQHMGHISANPCTPAEVLGGYSWGHKGIGPFRRWYLSWCCYLAHPYHGSKMGCFHQSKGNQEWRTPTMCGSSRRCLWSGHLMYLLVTGTMAPLRNKSNWKFISLSQLRGCQWENWFCIISSNDRFFSLLLLF